MGSPIMQELRSEEQRIFVESVDLDARDRCDQCGAQAFAVAYTSPQALLFCGHHFAKHEAVFAARGIEVVDMRARINERPSASSGVDSE